MRGFVTIYRRELHGISIGAWSWLLVAIALLLNGLFFLFYLKETGGDVDMSVGFALGGGWPFWLLVIVLPPLFTMRMISEEARTGLLEYLLTAPVTDAAVVTAKFAAALTYMALLWLSVPLYGLVLSSLGTAPDWGALWTGYLGAVLVSGLYCSIGILASAGTGTPLLAAFTSLVFGVTWLALPMLGRLTQSELITGTIRKLDLVSHVATTFQRGWLDTSQIVFFVACTAMFVFLAVRTVETRRWR